MGWSTLRSETTDAPSGAELPSQVLHPNARILILDDEWANVRVLQRALQRSGYRQVLGINDPREIVGAVQDFCPDLLTLDLHMPEMDGFTVLRRLRAEALLSVELPVLVLTGDESEPVKARALALGARDFVAKPFSIVEMLLRIENLLETRFLYQQLARENQSLENRVAERTRALDRAQTEILERLAYAAEFRDDETGQHTRRVGRLSAQIATQLRLPTESVDWMRRAAPLHDVGKIGIPDSILLKPGRLSPEEFEVVKSHTTIGAKILGAGGTKLIAMAEEIALYHHEWWDGTGYPSRACGTEIPRAARIVAVADFYDALTTDRPYRKAWGVAETVEEITRETGTHFDPDVVHAFLKVLETPAAGAPA